MNSVLLILVLFLFSLYVLHQSYINLVYSKKSWGEKKIRNADDSKKVGEENENLTPDNILFLESEPAYKRKKVSLEEVTNMSRDDIEKMIL